MEFNRRSFLKGMSLAAVAGAAGDVAYAGTKFPDGALKFSQWLDADVVVAGGGPAGVCAAVSAARMGQGRFLSSGSDALAGT